MSDGLGGRARRALRLRSRAGLASLFTALSAIAAAQPASTTQTPPLAPLPPRVGVDASAPVALPLQEAIALTLQQNNDIAVATLQREVAAQEVRAAEGAFDPRLVPTLTYERAVNPVASAIGGAANGRVEQNELAGAMRLVGRTPWAGGRFTLDFNASRLETNNQFQRLNPQFPTVLGVAYTQPLLRGRRIDLERREILIRRQSVVLSDAQLRRTLQDQVAAVEQAYWDLVFAAGNLEVQRTALAQAEAQVESNARQAQAGTLAPIDVVEAQTQVATFRQDVADAQQALTEAENALKQRMLASRSAPQWGQALLPAAPADRALPTLSVEEAVTMALRERPELQELETTRAQNEVEAAFFTDQARPQVDVSASYNLVGLAGTLVTTTGTGIGTPIVVPDILQGGLAQSLANIGAARFPTAAVQVAMDIPLRNRTATASALRAELVGAQIGRQRQQLEQTIEAEVRNALQAVASSRDRFAAAASERRNAQEQYESERRRFDSGLSTVFLVLERQTALVTAQARELRARADLNQAVALFDRAVGGTLAQHNVRIEA